MIVSLKSQWEYDWNIVCFYTIYMLNTDPTRSARNADDSFLMCLFQTQTTYKHRIVYCLKVSSDMHCMFNNFKSYYKVILFNWYNQYSNLLWAGWSRI